MHGAALALVIVVSVMFVFYVAKQMYKCPVITSLKNAGYLSTLSQRFACVLNPFSTVEHDSFMASSAGWLGVS